MLDNRKGDYMENLTTIKAYRDSKSRLIVIVDHPTESMEQMLLSIIGGNVPPIQHLSEPLPMETKDPDSSKAKEIIPEVSKGQQAKFVRNGQDRILMKPVAVMNIFEIKQYLLSQRKNIVLTELQQKKFATGDLDFILNVKSEKEVKSIAISLAEYS